MLLVILDQVFNLPGYAVARARLSTDQVVQVNHGCNEWAGYTGGVLLESDGRLRARFTGGPFAELPGHLLVEEQLQVGADAGEPWTNLTPARGLISGPNGAIWVTRVVAIDLRTGKVDDAPGWDSFGPVPLLDAQGETTSKVLFARGHTPLEGEPPEDRIAASVHLWDLASGTIDALATTQGPVAFLTLEGRTFIELEGELFELSPRGKLAPATLDPALELRPSRLEARSLDPGDAVPITWTSRTGSPIEVREGGHTRPPAVGYCGVDRALRLGDFVLVDDGLYAWPSKLHWPPR